jgi:lipoate-protein ligase A
MQHVIDQFTLPADHLALDEALLLAADEGLTAESFRLWEFAAPVVVAGRSSRVEREIDRPFCQSQGIPILRRCSGGASVVGGPGCLMYSVVLSFEQQPELQRIDVAHRYVMSRVLSAVQRQLATARLQGSCDLTWQDRKCSGNSLRIAKRHLLYHGTILYDFDLPLIARCLREPPRQPEYRQLRDHQSFLVNLPIDRLRLAGDLADLFGTRGQLEAEALRAQIRCLREQRYDVPAWHFRH